MGIVAQVEKHINQTIPGEVLELFQQVKKEETIGELEYYVFVALEEYKILAQAALKELQEGGVVLSVMIIDTADLNLQQTDTELPRKKRKKKHFK